MPTSAQVPEPVSDLAKTSLRRSAAELPEAVRSADLFRGQKSVVIEHNGSIYRLQATKLGKLILTK